MSDISVILLNMQSDGNHVFQNEFNVEHEEWEVVSDAHLGAAQTINVAHQTAASRWRRAFRKITMLLKVRFIWARTGHFLAKRRTAGTHTSRRYEVISSVWKALRPLTWQFASLFSHLKRTGGTLQYK